MEVIDKERMAGYVHQALSLVDKQNNAGGAPVNIERTSTGVKPGFNPRCINQWSKECTNEGILVKSLTLL